MSAATVALGLVDDPTNRRLRRSACPWARRSSARPGWAPGPTGWRAGSLLRLLDVAPEPVQLRLLVQGGADRGLARQPLTGSLHLVHRVAPGAVHRHDLGAMHEALTSIRNEIRLRLAPMAQRGRPLLGPAQIERLLAGFDRTAVHDPRDHRRHLAGRHRNDHLVEQRQSRRSVAEVDQRLPTTKSTEGHEVGIAESLSDGKRFGEVALRADQVALGEARQARRDQQVTALGAVQLVLVDQLMGAGQPTTATRHLALVEEREPQPERASHRSRHLVPLQGLAVRPRPDLHTVAGSADEIRAGCQPLEVVERERCFGFGRRKLLVGVSPGGIRERPSTSFERRTVQVPGSHVLSLAFPRPERDRRSETNYLGGRRRTCATGRTTRWRWRPTVRAWDRGRGARLARRRSAGFQVVGSFGAADNQPERRAIDAVALVLVLLGPAALAARDRWPLVAVAVSVAAADLYIGLGYPYGPIFLSVVVALFAAVQAGHRRSTWWLAAAGYGGFVVASLVDPRATAPGAVHLALVAGWLVVVLAVSDVVRIRRDQAAQRERAEHDERQRRAGEQRLRLAQELHDVLAHNISLINVQAGVALHLIDEQPDQARPALANIKEASRDALHELRTALDLLRHGEEAPLTPAPRLADLDTLVAGVRASGLEVRLETPRPDEARSEGGGRSRRCPPPSSWPRTGSCRKRSPTSPATHAPAP